MTPRLHWLWLPILVTGLSRFVFLADWPLAGDEGFSLVDSTDQFTWSNLRALAFAFNHYVAIPIFGETPFALRVGSALAGVGTTAVVGLGIARLYDARSGIATAWIFTLSPALLMHGQLGRYYMQSCLLAAVVLLATRFATVGSRRWLLVALAALIAGWFVVPTTVFVVPGLMLWALWNRRGLLERFGRPRPALVATLLGLGVAVAGLAAWYVRARYPTGPAHGVRYFSAYRLPVQTVALFSVATTLLVLAGLVVDWRDRERDDPTRTFLGLCTLGSGVTLAAVYPFIGLAPSHFVSICAPGLAVAGLLIARLWNGNLAARCAAVLLLLGPIKVLASHYVDGGRVDFRAAAEVIRAQGAPAQTVAAIERINVGYYLGEPWTVRPLEIVDGRPNGDWLVLSERRTGLETDAHLSEAIEAHCKLVKRMHNARFDHRINALRVYRCAPAP